MLSYDTVYYLEICNNIYNFLSTIRRLYTLAVFSFLPAAIYLFTVIRAIIEFSACYVRQKYRYKVQDTVKVDRVQTSQRSAAGASRSISDAGSFFNIRPLAAYFVFNIIKYSDIISYKSKFYILFLKNSNQLLRKCQLLGMVINIKKSCCLRIGPRCNVSCANISTHDGRLFSWVSELRYLGVFIVISHVFKLSLVYAKRSFHRAVIVHIVCVGECYQDPEIL